MPITQEQIAIAQNRQHDAAHDIASEIRLIAGPGSGKSFAIQERVKWLLEREIPPDRIFVISFTRASTTDLRNRIVDYCQNAGQIEVEQINVSTLHSLALRTLRTAGLLNYPTDPLVLDDYEQKNILDAEFSKASGYSARENVGYSPSRCKEIRIDYEAFCGTGQWLPPNHVPPDHPITDVDRENYKRFHDPRTQVYACVLPGEIVRQCVVKMQAGLLAPATLLNVQYLIVDEYQDLNPTDLEFVDRIIEGGANTFVAGDDDQSIYSFRFASPQGIQYFVNRFPETGDHELRECFRCPTNVLSTAQRLIENFSEPTRIPKNLSSLYSESQPPVTGVVHRWRFRSFQREARSIAESCSQLIAHGVNPTKIMILVNNKLALLPTLIQELETVNVNYETPKSDGFFESPSGRFILAILRIVCNPNDYVAHRVILGLRPRVGPVTCNRIADAVVENNLNYRDIFHQPLPAGILRGRELSAINHARDICQVIGEWSLEETLYTYIDEISTIITDIFGEQETNQWLESVQHIPTEITIDELNNYLRADTDEKQAALLELVYERLELPLPDEGLLPDKVKIMTMHGAKGLSAQIVFIPGLMEELLPGSLRQPYPGLVLEAARLLYVSITRAKAACILSFSTSRVVYGNFSRQTPSRFASHLDGAFVQRENGLTDDEVENICNDIQNL